MKHGALQRVTGPWPRVGAMGLAALVLAAQSASCAKPTRPPDPVESGPAIRTIELKPYFRDLRSVDARIGGRTLRLLFDTGAGLTSVVPRVAKDLGCVPAGVDVGHRMTGEPVRFGRCPGRSIEVGAVETTLDSMGVFDLDAVLPKELPPLDGVLGLDAFRGSTLTLDWPNARLTVSSSQNTVAQSPPLDVRLATGENGAFLTAFVRAEGNGHPLWLLLDSGNLRGTLVARWVTEPAKGAADGSVTLRGADGPVSLPYSVADLEIDGALGTDFLHRGPVTVNLQGAVARAAQKSR